MRQIGVGGFTVSTRAKQLVNQVLDSNRLTPGPMTERFENLFAELHGVNHALMCNSGTSALHMALAVLKEKHGWEDGDEVLVPALTFVATANACFHVGLKPVFVDVNNNDFCMDPTLITDAVTDRTRCVLPVHIGGHPANMMAINFHAADLGLSVIEDSCESMFATDYAPVGSMSDIGTFSTYAAHVISTGVGGICTTDDPELHVMLKSYMNHGRDPIYTRIDDDKEGDLADVVARRFSFVRIGHSFRATEMEAALGVAQLEEHAQIFARRNEIADLFNDAFHNLPLQLQKTRRGATNARMWYPIVCDARNRLVMYLEERGIETRMLLPLLNNPCYTMFDIKRNDYPVAKRLTDYGFDIGCHPEMSNADVEYVIDVVRQFFEF